MYESDGVSGPDGGISESLSDEALAHADRSDEQDVLVACQELEREGGIEKSSVECDGCGPVELRRTMNRLNDVYETRQPRPASSSWMRVTCNRSGLSHSQICSAQGASISSVGVSTLRGPATLSPARRVRCSSLGAGPSRARPTSSAASMYLRTVARDSPVPVAICRWLIPDCQRRTTSAISTLDTSLYAIAAPYIQDAAMVANPAPTVVNLLAISLSTGT